MARNNSKKKKNNNKYNDYDKELMKDEDKNSKSKSSTTGVPDLIKPRGSRHNDPNWYFSDTMKKTVANFAYTYPNGSAFDLDLRGRYANRVPGILILQHMPAFGGGSTTGHSTALNMAAHNIYSFVRHLNSGGSNYDAPDLLVYILCVSQLYSAHSWMRRLYGLLRTYDPNNWYKPEGIFNALGIDFHDFREHIVDFRAYINMFATKIATLKIPKDLGITKRHIWMYENIYKDEESVHAQLMMFEPDGFYMFNETKTETQTYGGAEYVPFFRERFENNVVHQMTYYDLVDYMDALVDASFLSEDHNIMSGDIFKAYQGNCEDAYQIDESYITEPVYEESFNLQVSNAVIGGCTASEGNATWQNDGIVQNPTTGGLTNNILFSYSGGNETIRNKIQEVLESKRFINHHKDDPTVDDNVEATRLIQIPRVVNAGGSALISYYEHAASGLIVNATIYYGSVDSFGNQAFRKLFLNSCYVFDNESPALFIELMTALNMFRCKPCFYFTDEVNGLSSTAFGYLNDLYTYTLIDKYTLDRMNDVAILGLLGIK